MASKKKLPSLALQRALTEHAGLKPEAEDADDKDPADDDESQFSASANALLLEQDTDGEPGEEH